MAPFLTVCKGLFGLVVGLACTDVGSMVLALVAVFVLLTNGLLSFFYVILFSALFCLIGVGLITWHTESLEETRLACIEFNETMRDPRDPYDSEEDSIDDI